MNRARGILLALLFWFLPSTALAQVATGTPPLGSFSGGPDTVNNANLNVHLGIPVVNKAGRGIPFYYLLGYDSSVWSRVTSGGTTAWTPAADWGWSGITSAATGSVNYTVVQHSCYYAPQHKYYYWKDYDAWVYIDPSGTAHAFGLTNVTDFGNYPCGGDAYPHSRQGVKATDNSGYTISNSPGSALVYSPSGDTIDPLLPSGSGATSIIDPNGNEVISNKSGSTTTFTDTLGRTALTVTGSGTPTSPIVLSYTAAGGAGSVAMHYVTKTVQTSFECSGIADFGPTQVNLLSSIILQDGESYAFTYEDTPGHPGNVTGRIKYISLPTGGLISYAYEDSGNTIPNYGINCADGTTTYLARGMPDSPSSLWVYQHSENGTAWQTTFTDPASNITTFHFQSVTSGTFPSSFETERDLPGGSETIYTCYNGTAKPCNSTAITLPINRRTVWTTLGAQTSEVDTAYDSTGYGLPTEVDEYDWGPTLSRKSLISYTPTSCGVTNTHVVDRPCTVMIQNSASTQIAKSTFNYDANGNMLSVTSGTSGTLTSNFTYNPNGTLATSKDAANNQTTYSYGGNSCGAFPDAIALPMSLSSSAVWNCDGAVPTSSTDANSKTTSFSYDNMNRLTHTGYPDGGSVSISYTPHAITTTTTIASGVTRPDTTNLDGLGRVSSQTVRSVTTETTYDNLGRVSTVSIDGSGAVDSYQYDALGRMTLTSHADGSIVQTSWSNPQCPTTTDEAGKTNQVCSDALGRVSKVFDGLGNETDYTYDVLNDLTKVTQGSQTPCLNNTASRAFTYDSLGRLLSACTPESGTTNYTYTSGGDLGSRVDARGITTCYGTWTGTSCDTSSGYDALHRLLTKSYSDGTPAANFFYDGGSGGFGSWVVNGLTNTGGRFYAACTSAAPTRVCPGGYTGVLYDFDAMGRVKDFWQCTPYNCGSSAWQMIYGYDLAGDVTGYSHPAGFTITNTVDSNQRITQITSSLSDSMHPNPLVQNISYTPWGALASLTDGCAGSGCVQTKETYEYNSRLQPISIKLGTTSNDSAFYSLTYNYAGSASPPCSGSQGAGDNGNVTGYTYTDNANPSLSHTATYCYDGVNRLTQATATPFGSGTVSYSQSYNYTSDGSGGSGRFGNMSCTVGGSGYCPQVSFDGPTNRIYQINGVSANYDYAGNLTYDGNLSYQYDAEDRLVQVMQGSTTLSTNTYNALGLQVRRVGPNGFTVDLPYDPDGHTTGFFNGAAGSWWEQQFWSGGRLLGHYDNGTTYLIHRGDAGSSSPTQITDASGAAGGDAILYPWGELWQYDNQVNVWWQFFGSISRYQADLDQYLTPNRVYRPLLGRWLTPDPMGGDVTNPQSLNRYAYGLNNPTTLIDPLGLDPCESFNPLGCPPDSGCEEWDNGSCSGNPTCDSLSILVPFGCVNPAPCVVLGFPCGSSGSYPGGPSGAPAPGAPPAGQPPLRGGMGYVSGPVFQGPIILEWPWILRITAWGLPEIAGAAADLGAAALAWPGVAAAVLMQRGDGVPHAQPTSNPATESENARAAEEQFNRDLSTCRKLKDPGARSRCYESALNRKNRREQGWDPLPPLITW